MCVGVNGVDGVVGVFPLVTSACEFNTIYKDGGGWKKVNK